MLNILQNYVFENDLKSTMGFLAIYLLDVESKSKLEYAMSWITYVSLMDLSGLQMKDGHFLYDSLVNVWLFENEEMYCFPYIPHPCKWPFSG